MTDLERAQRIVLESVHGTPGLCADIADALAAARREGAEAEREKVAAFMLARGVATGHGDTTEDLLLELGDAWDLRPQEGAEEMRERAAALVFDEYSLDGDLDGVAAAIRALPLTPEKPT